jgi:cysteine synthase A
VRLVCRTPPSVAGRGACSSLRILRSLPACSRRERNSSCKLVAVEPDESCLLMCGEVGRHLIEGISDGFVPGIFARHGHLIDEIVAVDSDAAISEMRRLAREFGLFVGPSSGAHLLAARELRARYPDLRHVVTFFCDEGEKYINDYFLGTGSGG